MIDDDGAVADAQRSIRVGGGTIPGADLAIGGLGGITGLWILSQVAAIARWIGRTIRRWLDGNNQTNDNDGDNQLPTSEIQWHPEKPAPGHPVLFDGSLSVDPDPNDQIVAFRWSIDDKYVRTPRFVHAFLKAGTYDVSLEVRNSRGETGRETKSITVEESAGELVLDRVHPDSPGNDHENLRAEYLVFKNAGDETLALGGWTVHDGAEAEDRVTAGDHTFTFPDGTEVAACSTVTLHTGAKPDHGEADAGPPGSLHLYWAKRWPVWNNDEDIIVVEADDGSPVLASRYTRTGDEYELDALEFEILEDWFPDVIVSPRGNTPLLSIDVSLGIRSLILGVAGFIASAFFLRGAAAFVRAWAVITGFLLPAIGAWAVSPTLPRVTHSIEPIIPLVLTAGSLLVLLVSGTGLVVQRAISAGWSMITG